MRKLLRLVFWVSLAVSLQAGRLAASETGFRGLVTDNTGRPVRGAMIKANIGDKTVARFTQANGRYEMILPPGTYDVSVEAYGFGGKRLTKDAAVAGDTNFSVTPKFDVYHLSSADLETLLPDNQETKFIKGSCVVCHSFGTIEHKSGFTAEEWQSFIPTMTRGRLSNPTFSPAAMATLTAALAKYLGPDAAFFGPDAEPPSPSQVQHADLPDAVLNATIREYTIPTGLPSMPHSIMLDAHDNAWFSERGLGVHKIGRFEPGPEKFTEYPVPNNGIPHTGVVGKGGIVWMSLVNGPDLASVDPETGKVTTYAIADRKRGVHTVTADPDGNIWCSGSAIWKFDVQKQQFREYKIPLPDSFPENSIANWNHVTGDPLPHIDDFYDVKADSNGIVWASVFGLGELVRIDGATGQTKQFQAPDTPSIRGIEIDAQDNIWFAGFNGYTLGKFDQKTERFSLYHPPTRFAMPYGVAADKRTGIIWFADLNGNHITRFDPKTEQFTEFPIPSANANSRFIGIDSKGRVWFTEWINAKIGVLDPGDAMKQVSSNR